MESWKSERIENGRRIEKWEDNIDLISILFVWLGVEKWRDGKNEFV